MFMVRYSLYIIIAIIITFGLMFGLLFVEQPLHINQKLVFSECVLEKNTLSGEEKVYGVNPSNEFAGEVSHFTIINVGDVNE